MTENPPGSSEPGVAVTGLPGRSVVDRQDGRIVVGYDGSPDSCAALDWAAALAHRTHLPLTVLHVVDYLGQLPGTLPAVPTPQRVEQAVGPPAELVAAEGVHLARTRTDSIDITAVTHVARVAYSLIEHSRDAALLVVGTRGRGELGGAILGSVSFAAVGHAHCPVVVVRGDSRHPPGPDRPIVVGVDASPGSDAAVRLAADRAAAEAAPLLVVAAYQSVSAQVWAEAAGSAVIGRSFAQAAQHAADLAVEAATDLARRHQPGLDVQGRSIEGPAKSVLTATATGAGLLVVGTRGRGGFAGLRLGSVSHNLIHSSPCPIAVTSPASDAPGPQ